jgi:hypothetical protein
MAIRVQPLTAASNTKIITIRMGLSCALHCIDLKADFFKPV